ncbi:MAG: YbaK/EbsC family protein [Candidatus Thiodiazotropha sp. (ex Lucina aurantia)]|nr:YbaK/EbsC family protein [Candidatus Thiodiazotropha sp. (ex Lucina pensylvanica)]MBT3017751.1 YbaK/EbsC family protein [Candidatus Thiodiazotropha taylori]MBT3040798.1 YbaK/EbsC family protein [Candidatus Thiodiazotropha sp. (ex Codakia orbicularis)]MBV2103861.1 YbaK/EbsC family protein [Candidatus Thiodiazotropha sp. (ex Lucina aurantia)]MCW4290307.1 YbaK/EbsC family protein [Candidatus Thiodiazotropha endolucinida]
MAIAITLREYLQNQGVSFDVIDHRRTDSTLHTAEAAHIPGDRMAKSVLLGDDESYLLAVIPATHRLELEQLKQLTGRKLSLISEDELQQAFADCETGAVPPTGMPYGIETLVDASLLKQPDLYFESGDHGKLIHISVDKFRELESEAIVAEFSRHL